MSVPYDALLIVSFGGPEQREDVLPFLENVLRGKNVPRERMLEVAEHYYHFDGVSPINAQNRALIAALEQEFAARGPHLPIYWGNRNWHPLLGDTLRRMQADGVRRALAFFTSAYSSYSGCRQYRENIQRAQEEVRSHSGRPESGRPESALPESGSLADVPQVDKLRVFFNHPGFIAAMVERVQAALAQIPAERHATTQLVFTAHSIPEAMARGCQYVVQLQEASRLVAERVGRFERVLVYQSRSGPASQPWLEPDVGDHLRLLRAAGQFTDVVVVPIGFISDHMEILFDLDTEARQVCQEAGLNMVRAQTVGTHPLFISMIRELVLERIEGGERRAWGNLGASHDVCPENCCLSGRPPLGAVPGKPVTTTPA